MNFIPEFYQVLSSIPHNNEMEKLDMKKFMDSILDEVEEDSKIKKSTSKTNCWITFSDWNKKQTPIMTFQGERIVYVLPKITTLYPHYNGPLLQIDTGSIDYIKPSSLVKSGGIDVKAKELKLRDSLDTRGSKQIIQKINTIEWEGTMFSLSFKFNSYLPVRFESEYILIPCSVN